MAAADSALLAAIAERRHFRQSPYAFHLQAVDAAAAAQRDAPSRKARPRFRRW